MANAAGLKAALLDFDQTLVDLPVDWDGIRSEVSGLFRKYGIASPMRPLLAGMTNAFAELELRGASPGVRGSLRRMINGVLTSAEMAAAARARAMPGARELVAELRDHRVSAIIQSSNSIHAIQHALDRLEFPPVDAILGRETARRPKPDPQAVRSLLRRLGLGGEECVVIGDGAFDIEIGTAIGATTIIIGTGRTQADYSVASLNQVAPLLFGKQPRAA